MQTDRVDAKHIIGMKDDDIPGFIRSQISAKELSVTVRQLNEGALSKIAADRKLALSALTRLGLGGDF